MEQELENREIDEWFDRVYAIGLYEKEKYEDFFDYCRKWCWNDSRAMVWMAICYAKGIGIEKSITESWKRFLGSILEGGIQTSGMFAVRYQAEEITGGIGVRFNAVKDIFLRSHASEEAFVEYMLGRCYETGKSMDSIIHTEYKPIGGDIRESIDQVSQTDKEKAFQHYYAAAEKGYVSVWFEVGRCFEYGFGTEKNLKNAFEAVKKGAELGDPLCGIYEGILLENGIGVPKDGKEAKEIYERFLHSELSGYAYFCLGRCYYHGSGTKKDFSQALVMFEKVKYYLNHVAFVIDGEDEYLSFSFADLYMGAIKSGEHKSFLGNYYGIGSFREEDHVWSELWYIKQNIPWAVTFYEEAGAYDSLFALAEFYRTGQTGRVEKSLEKAFHLYEKINYPIAKEILGVYYYYGCCIKKDYVKAVQLFQEAINESMAEKEKAVRFRRGSDGTAQFYLGMCYEYGRGIKKSEADAWKCFRTAAEVNRNYEGYLGLRLVENAGADSFDEYEEGMMHLKHAAEYYPSAFEPAYENCRKKGSSKNAAVVLKYLLDLEEAENFETRDRNQVERRFRFYSWWKERLGVKENCMHYNTMKIVEERNRRERDKLEELIKQCQDSEKRLEILAKENMELRQENTQLHRKTEEFSDIREQLNRIDVKVTNIDTGVKSIQSHLSEYIQEERARLTILESSATKEMEKEQRIAEFIDKVTNYINERTVGSADELVKAERVYLEKLFGKEVWDEMHWNVKNALISSQVQWKNCMNIRDKFFDFSGICITASGALEKELKRYFFYDFRDFLQRKYGETEGILGISFSLGSIAYLFNQGRGDEASQEQKNLRKKRLEEYLRTVVKEQYKENPIAAFERIDFVKRCENVRVEYRNKAAHGDTVRQEEAGKCCAEIIGKAAAYEKSAQVKGILMDLHQILRINGKTRERGEW